MTDSFHDPVMPREVVDSLQVKPNQWYVDATVGGGGHADAILAAGGNVLGIDQDRQALVAAKQRLHSGGYEVMVDPDQPIALNTNRQQAVLLHGNFADLSVLVAGSLGQPVAGVLFDLGVSSHQLDQLERGFSFQSPSLDMRMDPTSGLPASTLVASLGEQELAMLFVDFGEERYARRFARAIVSAREKQPITAGSQLAEIVIQASPPAYRHGRIHPATRVFQALRIAVNDELTRLAAGLSQAVDVLQPGGRLAVISFHSLEDRLVKRFFVNDPKLMVVSKKPIVARPEEITANPRSRSAKLRVATVRS